MKTFIILAVFLISNSFLLSQSINGKLGTGGQFIIRDTNNTFLSLSQASGNLTLTRSFVLPIITGGSQLGTIFKGNERFLHTYRGTGTSEGFNTFLGINSGSFNLGGSFYEGSYNSGVGNQSLTNITTGSYNSAFGWQSLYLNTTGEQNSAFGGHALGSNTTGYENSAFGTEALGLNSTGTDNCAFGLASLLINSTGSFNCAFGKSSLANNSTGSNNIAIGFNTQVPSGTSSNQIRMGNASITYAGIEVAWTITSDRRWKDKIQPSKLGLNFINKLNPVSYTRMNDESGKTEFGIIAQEVEQVLIEEGAENSGMLMITDEGKYELRYNDLIAPMIKAIQELKAENDELRSKLNSFEQMQSTFAEELEKLKSEKDFSRQVQYDSDEKLSE